MPPKKERSKRGPSSLPPAPWTVYLLRCRGGSLYCGITNDLVRRLATHAAGKASRYTRSRLPVKLAYAEPQPTRSAALKREAAIKRLPRRRKQALIGAGVFETVEIEGRRVPRCERLSGGG